MQITRSIHSKTGSIFLFTLCLLALLLPRSQVLSDTLWNDSISPNFAPLTGMSAAGGNLIYDYYFVVGTEGGNAFPAYTWVYGYTYDHETVGTNNVDERGLALYYDHAIRQHCNAPDFSYSTASYTLSDPTDFWAVADQADLQYQYYGTYTTTPITGTGVSNSYCEIGSYSESIPDATSCAYQVGITIYGYWCKIHLEVAQGNSVPSLCSPGSNSGGGSGTGYPWVTIRFLENAGCNYFGGVYNGAFKVTRCYGSTSGALTVNFTKSGTAVDGSDYHTIGTSMTIPAGSSSANLTITPYYDPSDTDETVTVTLAAGSYGIASDGTSCDPSGSDSASLTILSH